MKNILILADGDFSFTKAYLKILLNNPSNRLVRYNITSSELHVEDPAKIQREILSSLNAQHPVPLNLNITEIDMPTI